MDKRKMVAPASGVTVKQGVTVALYEWRRNGFLMGLIPYHHPTPELVYMRGGKKRCISNFRSKESVIASIRKG